MSTILPENILKCLSPADRAKLGAGNMLLASEAIAAAEIRCERDLQAQLKQYAQLQGWIVLGGKFGVKTRRTKGESDLCFLLPGGIVLFVECKTETGKLSDDQTKMRDAMAGLEHTMHVVRSFDEFRALCIRALSDRIGVCLEGKR